MRRKIAAGNWKMNPTTLEEAKELASKVCALDPDGDNPGGPPRVSVIPHVCFLRAGGQICGGPGARPGCVCVLPLPVPRASGRDLQGHAGRGWRRGRVHGRQRGIHGWSFSRAAQICWRQVRCSWPFGAQVRARPFAQTEGSCFHAPPLSEQPRPFDFPSTCAGTATSLQRRTRLSS